MLVLVGRCTSLIEVGSLDKVIKSLVPGCTCTTTRGPVMVLQIRLLCFCFAASVLGWVPSPEPSLRLVLPRSAEEQGAGDGAALVQGLRRLPGPGGCACGCALVGIGNVKYQGMSYTVDLH